MDLDDRTPMAVILLVFLAFVVALTAMEYRLQQTRSIVCLEMARRGARPDDVQRCLSK